MGSTRELRAVPVPLTPLTVTDVAPAGTSGTAEAAAGPPRRTAAAYEGDAAAGTAGPAAALPSENAANCTRKPAPAFASIGGDARDDGGVGAVARGDRGGLPLLLLVEIAGAAAAGGPPNCGAGSSRYEVVDNVRWR